MTDPVTLHNLYYLIDTNAWLAQRIGPHQPEPSAQLDDFMRCDMFDEYRPAMDTAARMRLWCAARGYDVAGGVIEHDNEHLTKPVTILLATATGVPRCAVALVSIDGASPDVYADVTTDEGYWLDATSIAFTCPAGHGWRWDGERYLHGEDGAERPVRELYGPGGSVISRCRDCQAFDDDTTDDLCPCSGFAVYCPTCQQRCRVELADVPTYPQQQS